MQDIESRKKVAEYQAMQKSLETSLLKKFGKMFSDFQEENEIDNLSRNTKADPRVIKFQEDLGKAFVKLYHLLDRPFTWPKIFPISGTVKVKEIEAMPPVKIENVREFAPYFDQLQKQLRLLTHALSLISQQPPKSLPAQPLIQNDETLHGLVRQLIQIQGNMPKTIQAQAPVINAPAPIIQKDKELHELIRQLIDKVENQKVEVPWDKMEFPDTINIGNFPPTYIPTPVTHVSINSLNGNLLTTAINLTDNTTPMPATPLENRRAIQLFNNGSNTIYMGGSNVTTSNGIPIASGAFSDVLGFGENINVYAISASGQTNDVRVLEVADEASGR